MDIITLEELKAAVASDHPPQIAEALPEKYYRHGHLPNARHLPHDRVPELAPHLLPDREALIVVYCANEACKNSHQAAEALLLLGYRHVRVFVEGKAAWQAAGLPLER